MTAPDQPEHPPHGERGSALLIILTIIGIGAAILLVSALNKANLQIGKDKVTSATLAKAKEALIGYAATYRDTHTNEVFGYLPLPDLGSSRNGTPEEGNAAGNFTGNAKNMTVIGRLPWRTLGLPALRDSQGECLWLAVSGAYQNVQQTAFMNWDMLGQFDTFSSDGTPGGTINTIGTNYHQRPAAVIFAPGAILTGQSRTTSAVDTVTECGGNYNTRNYLDTFTANPLINSIVNYFTGTNNATGTYLFASPKALAIGPVSDAAQNTLINDRLLAITPDDLFRTIRRRSDFKTFVDENLLNLAKNNLGLAFPAPATIDFTNPVPTETSGGTTVGSLEIGRVPASALTTKSLKNWQDNLLYAKCTSGGNCLTVNGVSYRGVVIFPGERSNTQTRATNAQKNTWANYLENALTAFTPPGATTFAGVPLAYSPTAPTQDVWAGITTVTATQKSFAANFASFVPAGVGVTTNATDKTVTVADAAGTSGGCFWFPNTIPLAGKIVRAYYDYKFSFADTFALTGSGTDRGNGFTFQMVRNDIGPPSGVCGREADMGALSPGVPVGLGDPWGLKSFIFETDVHKDAGNADPNENHTAIMAYGNLIHGGSPTPPGNNGYLSTACNGTAPGCRHAPANKFEESPSPLDHNQRIEIHTGCNSTCSTCDPAHHLAPNTYARITAWVDCTDCDDIIVDLDRTAKTPTINRCIDLDTELNSFYFGFTGGFRSGAARQGVTIQNFQLRSE